MPKAVELLAIGGQEVAISNPGKILFPDAGHTKLDLVRYYIAVAEGALRGAGGRPNVLVRYPNGVGGDFFFQKRAPESRPAWIEVVTLSFPSGNTASEIVPRDAAALAWMANLACLELHPHPVRADDLDHPDELRVDLDPVPGVSWQQIREVARVVRATLSDFGLTGWPKTSGSRGMHVYVRIERRWSFDEVRRAALALAREVEQRVPALATSKWWKEERHGVFIDYNQNAKDRTVAAAYSVRPTADARVSAPLTWDEVDSCEPGDFTLQSMPARFIRLGDLHAAIDAHPGSLEGLLELSARHEREGQGDAPWPPQYKKQPGEPPRVQPSRRATKHPLIEIARAQRKDEALAGLERWKVRHAAVASHLAPADVLVDAMRGRSSTWTRIRINLQHVPTELRPSQGPLDPDNAPEAAPEDAPRQADKIKQRAGKEATVTKESVTKESGPNGAVRKETIPKETGPKETVTKETAPRKPARVRKAP
ncbi:MAG: DNA polymerase domain-containing protein [Burkholderiaceae bacterium]|nr:DNA polymerase domain-containing protein [Burkholderiaceae bacterium]